ncbi:hypothetical protein [Pseudomonas sp. TUM22785]|uniref:hypothetical protein n=1 Tax=Pseudomonas sp. TUM22785 TaxID=3019098 RepID=UPI002305CB93|nr:hypothetical protein [Pseudomonas sp. TUM22785]WCD82474.1 hypothetical protein PI990_10800 [Pseudomonas sp. TUM22785]
MSYLFQDGIEAALRVESMRGNASYLKSQCEQMTQKLINDSPRHINIHDDLSYAESLIFSMGNQFKPSGVAQGEWAGDYVSEWRMVSGNAGVIRGMVSNELYRAYQIGLDIRSNQVVGKMFKLAVMVWSTIGDYSSPTQNEGRR